MKISLLSDNIAGEGFLGEFGFSAFVEANGKKLLFDSGASDIFSKNASRMGIDLSKSDFVFISHGHWDHANGLKHLMENFDTSKMTFISHPGIFQKRSHGKRDIGIEGIGPKEILDAFKKCIFSREAIEFSKGLTFLGEVDRSKGLSNPVGDLDVRGKIIADPVIDDSAMVIRTEKGNVLLTGCSHSGITNLARAADSLGKLCCVLGGFHLASATKGDLDKTIKELKGILRGGAVFPGHCTGEQAILRMEDELGAAKLHTGKVIEI